MGKWNDGMSTTGASTPRLTPDRIAFLVSQNEGIVTPHHFAGENEFNFALLFVIP